MRIHELKTLHPFFAAVVNGTKKCEFRKYDRDFCVGDLLRLQEYEEGIGYSGAEVTVAVTHTLSHGDLNIIPEGYCLMSFVRVGGVAGLS